MASVSVLAGSAVCTTTIRMAGDVNKQTVQPTQAPLGIVVSTGLHFVWVAFAFHVMSILLHAAQSVQSCHLFFTIPGT